MKNIFNGREDEKKEVESLMKKLGEHNWNMVDALLVAMLIAGESFRSTGIPPLQRQRLHQIALIAPYQALSYDRDAPDTLPLILPSANRSGGIAAELRVTRTAIVIFKCVVKEALRLPV